MKICKSLLAIALAFVLGSTIASAQLLPPSAQQPAAPAPSQPQLLPHFGQAQPMQPKLIQAPLQPPQNQVQPAQFQLQPPANQPPAAAATPAAAPAATFPAATSPAAPGAPATADEVERSNELRERFLGLTGEAWGTVKAVWEFEIVRGAKKEALVTVGTLVGGLVLMGFGYIAAGVISRWVGARLLSRLGLNKTAVSPLQKIVYYVLLITFAMLTLNILNVPITVFSFAGGAIAVGVGFGSQNIVNNFISGLILLGERPIRVGDVIEIDGRTGRVTEIGARSTRIATGNNFEVIVPNSKFLESQVVNWTLTDDRISTSVRVGVSYGSPTREVERLLKLAASEHTDVAQDPAPSVAFEDFADDALVFSVSFWIDLQSASKGKVESDIRFRIDELFNEAGIVIAYPQRDVHLNMMRPLEVRLAPEASREFRRVAA